MSSIAALRERWNLEESRRDLEKANPELLKLIADTMKQAGDDAYRRLRDQLEAHVRTQNRAIDQHAAALKEGEKQLNSRLEDHRHSVMRVLDEQHEKLEVAAARLTELERTRGSMYAAVTTMVKQCTECQQFYFTVRPTPEEINTRPKYCHCGRQWSYKQ